MNWIWLLLFLATATVGYLFWKKPADSPVDIKPPIVEPMDNSFPSGEDHQPGSVRSNGPLGDTAIPKVEAPPQQPQQPSSNHRGYPGSPTGQMPGQQPPPPAEMYEGGGEPLPPPSSPSSIAPDDPMYEPMPNNPGVDPGTNNFEGQEMAPPPPVYEPPATDDYVVPDNGGDGDF